MLLPGRRQPVASQPLRSVRPLGARDTHKSTKRRLRRRPSRVVHAISRTGRPAPAADTDTKRPATRALPCHRVSLSLHCHRRAGHP
jgi:hypothetical protein